MKPTAPHSPYTLDNPIVEEKDTEKIDKVAYIKLNDDCVCENKELDLVYKNNVNDQRANHRFQKIPIAFQFLKMYWIRKLKVSCFRCGLKWVVAALKKKNRWYHSQDLFWPTLWLTVKNTPRRIVWITNKHLLSNMLFLCLNTLVLYLIIFFFSNGKDFYDWLLHRVIKNYCDSRCEKGLKSNQHIKLCKTDDQGNKRLSDDVGFISNSCTECLLIESSR